MTDAILVLDTQRSVIVHANQAVETLFGYAPRELIGQTSELLMAEPGGFDVRLRQALAALETRTSLRAELRTKHRDGRQLVTEHVVTAQRDQHGHITHVVTVIRDLTQRSMAEQQRMREARLDPLGPLAGGIAHDFNNYLAAILGNVSLAKTTVGTDHPSHELLEQATRACERARSLTTQLLTFSRGGSPVRRAAALNEMIRDCAEFAVRGSAVTCDLAFGPELWQVLIDPGQLGSALHNILLNAVQAMPDGGTIEVQARNETLGPAELHDLSPGRYVRVCIVDQGVGIPAADLERIFDPYFTTKGSAGLGLAACARIVRQLGGSISVRSQPGTGTRFDVLLPAAPLATAPASAAVAPPPATTKGRVLLMDDEDMLRGLAQRMLRYLGWDAVTTRDGAEAVAAFVAAREQQRPFDLVILDLTVPGGVGGVETLGRLLALDRHVQVIASSGYSDDAVMANPESVGFVGVLPKPYDVEALRTVLAASVDRDREVAPAKA